MSKIPFEPGRAVFSKAGRDAGRHFIILRVESPFVYIADGQLRKVEAPKKKKVKHVRPVQDYYPAVAGMLEDGKIPSNAEIRRCLADWPRGRNIDG